MTTSDEQIMIMTMTRAEITDLLASFAEAQRLSDVDDLSRLLTDDFKVVGPLGFVVPKQEWLKTFRTGMLQIQSLEWDQIEIRTHADAYFAIAIGRLTQAATYARKPANGQFRVTAIAIRRSAGL